MEPTGIRIDPAELSRLSALMETEIARLTDEIHGLAGKPFNISSPQQLGKVLFEDLKLPAPVKYGKGKTISTAADVLEELAAEHEIVRKVLEYRQLTKLKGTYVDALPALIAATRPPAHQLQPGGRGHRAAVVVESESAEHSDPHRAGPRDSRRLRAARGLEADGRRLLADRAAAAGAHVARPGAARRVPQRRGHPHAHRGGGVGRPAADGHARARRNAKAVNFGIVYGISAFGLAAQLGIPRGEAEKYIKAYFERYAGVRNFIDATIAEVRQTGVTRTLFGRERPIPDINSRNPNARGFAERTAVNSPLQGTAADLIKLAMIRIDSALTAGGYRSKLLLQVHDELVLESPPEEIGPVTEMVKREMEAAYPLEVPLLVEVGVGDNWRDAK